MQSLTAEAAYKPDPKPIHVLVVDDEPDICDYVSLLLQEKGDPYNVHSLTDPHKVIPFIKKLKPHIVILDLMMPGIHGIKLLEMIRKEDADISVIIHTGNTSASYAIQALQLRASDFLPKPCSSADLHAALGKIVKEKGLVAKPEEELHRAIGVQIRNARQAQDLTLKQLAQRTNLSVSLLSQIERAESSASILTLFRIASALNVPMSELFTGF
jgi:DNA-binding NtrC family response regulator